MVTVLTDSPTEGIFNSTIIFSELASKGITFHGVSLFAQAKFVALKALYFMSGHSFLPILQSIITRYGIDRAVLSPGSRNAPLIRMLLAVEGMQTHNLADERVAGFSALGMAMQLQKPVVLCCTSGTAVLNLYPAVCEAYYARIPLIVLTADRPPEMIDQWDGQCIRQKDIFAQHIGKSLHLDAHSDADIGRQGIHELMQFAISRKLPVHINIALEEPLYESWEFTSTDLPGSENLSFESSTDLILTPVQGDLGNFKKILVLYGADARKINLPKDVVVLSDFISGRKPEQNIRNWDALLSVYKDPVLKPDLLITSGSYTISKGLKQFLRNNAPELHIHIDHGQGYGNMFQTQAKILSPEAFHALTSDQNPLTPDDEYLESWKSLSEAMILRMKSLFAQSGWNEFAAVNRLLSIIPPDAALHVSNSMPVRYVSLLDARPENSVIRANRGTSGIDGCTSTAVGYAMCSKKPVYLITGDIAFFYDVNALWNPELPSNLRIIVLNNFGGSIFRLLEGPSKFPEALKYQETPHQRTASGIAAEFGLMYFCARSFEDLESLFDQFVISEGPALLEIQTNKTENTAFYQEFKNIQL